MVRNLVGVGVQTQPKQGLHLLLGNHRSAFDGPHLLAHFVADFTGSGVGQRGQAAAGPTPR